RPAPVQLDLLEHAIRLRRHAGSAREAVQVNPELRVALDRLPLAVPPRHDIARSANAVGIRARDHAFGHAAQPLPLVAQARRIVTALLIEPARQPVLQALVIEFITLEAELLAQTPQRR